MNNQNIQRQEGSDSPPTLVTPKQAARDLGISPRTLANWRSIGRPHIQHTRVGRGIRYYQSAIDNYLAKNAVHDEEA